MDKGKGPPTHLAYTLLARGHSPETASNIFLEKFIRRPLIVRPGSPEPNSKDARAARRLVRVYKRDKLKRKQKVKSLSAKRKRELKIFDIPKEEQKYDLYLPLHNLWASYMQEVLDLKAGEAPYITAQNAGSKVASADFHGAYVTVVRSNCVGRVGLQGLVLKDTKFTFEIITPTNQLKTVPKNQTIFKIEVPAPKAECNDEMKDAADKPHVVSFEIHGSQIELRAPDRATKKFKQQRMDML